MTTRRQRIDSTSAAIEIMQKANKEILPPATVSLEGEDLIFFRNIIAECPKSEWTGHKIEMAAILARTMADLYREQTLLREEGAVVTGSMGSPVPNPRKSVVQMLASNITAYRRSLSLHARGQGGEAHRIGRRREIARSIEDDDLFDDDLIAKPPN
jgi:hypothetical protein